MLFLFRHRRRRRCSSGCAMRLQLTFSPADLRFRQSLIELPLPCDWLNSSRSFCWSAGDICWNLSCCAWICCCWLAGSAAELRALRQHLVALRRGELLPLREPLAGARLLLGRHLQPARRAGRQPLLPLERQRRPLRLLACSSVCCAGDRLFQSTPAAVCAARCAQQQEARLPAR